MIYYTIIVTAICIAVSFALVVTRRNNKWLNYRLNQITSAYEYPQRMDNEEPEIFVHLVQSEGKATDNGFLRRVM